MAKISETTAPETQRVQGDAKAWTSSVERVLALGGLVWAILFVVAFAMAGEEPAASAPIGEIRGYFDSWPDAATVLYGLAGIGLVGYLAVLALRLVGSAQRTLGATAISGAAVSVIVQTAGDVAFLSLTLGEPRGIGQEQARTMLQVHEASHALQPYLIAVFTVCAGIVAIETRVIARWLGWAGLALGACMLVVGTGSLVGAADFAHDSDAAIATFLLFIAWVGGTSVSMAKKGVTNSISRSRSNAHSVHTTGSNT